VSRTLIQPVTRGKATKSIAVIEMANSALAPSEPAVQRRTLKTFEALSQAMLDHFLAEPVDESYIELVRRSIDDVSLMLTSNPDRVRSCGAGGFR
jgi:hypothetical protein